MKIAIATISIFFTAGPVLAGGLAPAVMNAPMMIAEESASSFSAWIIPLIILAVLVSMTRTCREVRNSNINSNTCGPL